MIPTNDNTSPDLTDVLDLLSAKIKGDIRVCLPATVQSYNSANHTATVTIGVKRVLRTEEGGRTLEDFPALKDIPVVAWKTLGFFMSMPVSAGVTGHLEVSDYSLESWLENGVSADPQDLRAHTLTGAFFVPGLSPKTSRLSAAEYSANELSLGAIGGLQIRIGTTLGKLGVGAVDFMLKGTAFWASFSPLLTAWIAELSAFNSKLGAEASAWSALGGDAALQQSTRDACNGAAGAIPALQTAVTALITAATAMSAAQASTLSASWQVQ